MSPFLLLLSYIFSLITVGLSLFLKVPQIVNLYRVGSAPAISLKGLMLELLSYTTTACYNYVNGYSLLTYLEYPIILIQEVVLIYLVLYYRRLINKDNLIWCGVYFLITSAFLFRILPGFILTFMIPFTTPVSASSKIIQLSSIIRSQSSHGISMLTWFISAFTNFTRAFTVYMDSADVLILSNLMISGFLSSSIMAAVHIYRPRYIISQDSTTSTTNERTQNARKVD